MLADAFASRQDRLKSPSTGLRRCAVSVVCLACQGLGLSRVTNVGVDEGSACVEAALMKQATAQGVRYHVSIAKKRRLSGRRVFSARSCVVLVHVEERWQRHS